MTHFHSIYHTEVVNVKHYILPHILEVCNVLSIYEDSLRTATKLKRNVWYEHLEVSMYVLSIKIDLPT